MNSQILLVAPVLIPLLLGIFILPLVRRNPKGAAALVLGSVILSGLAFLISFPSSPRINISWVGPFSISFSLSSWKTFLLGFVFLFQIMTAVYALGSTHRLKHTYLHPLALLIAFASACLVILTDSLLMLVIGWELFLVALYAMIHSGGEQAEPAARKALIIGGTSDFLMILGLMFYYYMAPDQGMASGLSIDTPMAFWSFFLIFLGAGAKAGMFPFHTWIPDAAQVMPASGFAAMPASLEKVLGIYFLFVLTHQVFILNTTARTAMFILGIATVFVSIIPALVEKDLRKLLALTAISPVGFMICGMAVSEAAGFAGALLYMLTHATYKSAMFFSVGNFEEKAGSSQLDRLLGIARSMPVSAAAFFLAFIAAISLPPTGGFIAKELILEGTLESGHIVILILLVVGAILNVAVFSKVIAVLWAPGNKQRNEASGSCVYSALITGITALASGGIFYIADGLLSEVTGAHETGLLSGVWHLSFLTVVSLAIYALGILMYAAARSGRKNAAEAFSRLTNSPVLGPALRMAEEKKFDGYEIGIKVVDFVTNIVFRYVERMIDVVGDGIIGSGRWLLRPVLSGAHNGIYGNYLCWAVVGFIIVCFFLFGSAL